jgi:hypothetical protein
MGLKKLLKDELHLQLPQVRFEFYRWTTVLLLAGIGILIPKINAVTLGLSEAYVYGAVLVICLVGLSVILSKLGKVSKQQEGSQTNDAAVSNRNAPIAYFSLLMVVCIALVVWNLFLQHRVRRLEIEAIRYTLPRELTKGQIKSFGVYLAANSKPRELTIEYVQGDEEATQYASELREAFLAGNWYPNMSPIAATVMSCQKNPSATDGFPLTCVADLQKTGYATQGTRIDIKGPMEPTPLPPTIEERVHPPKNIGNILIEALKNAGMEKIGVSGSGWEDSPTGTTITLFVGSRQRSKLGNMSENFRELIRHGKSPEDLTDDDY